MGGGGDFGPDEPGADDHHPGRPAQQFGAQAPGVVQGAQGVDAGEAVRTGEAAGGRAGGDHDAVGVDPAPVGEDDRCGGAVQVYGAFAQLPVDAQLFVLLGVPEFEGVGRDIALEVGLGQRRAVVGAVQFLSYDGDTSVVSLGAQRPDGAESGERGSDESDVLHAGSPTVT